MKTDLKHSNALVTQRLDEVKKEMLYLDCYSRRENLNFFGLDEEENEDTKGILETFMQNHLGITNTENIEFQRIHRVGKTRQDGSSRPIIARFLRFQDRQRVIRAAYKLRNTGYKIMEDFPKEIIERRRPLVPIMKDAKANGKTAFFLKSMPDKLIIDGKVYT